MENHGNLILIDWLTVTSHCDDVENFQRILGMDDNSIPWETLDAYMNGYPKRTFWNGITICWGSDREDMGVCLTMSGQGCRTFETYGNGDWLALLSLFSSSADYNITRLDLAYDDHTGILDIDQLREDTDDGYYVSKSRWWMVEYGSEGTSIYHGSPRSDIRIRIYDKARERGFKPDDPDFPHWIRVELQLRQKRAGAAVAAIVASGIGNTMCGVLRNYLTYRDPSGDSNKSRWELAPYWAKLLNGVAAISLWDSPGEDYNISRVEQWLVKQCGGALLTWHQLYNISDLIYRIKQSGIKLSPKYQRIVDEFEYKKRLEDPGNEKEFPEVDDPYNLFDF